MSTILVTGGAGFIGSHLVRALLRDTGHTVVNLDALTYAGNLDSLADVAGEPRHVFVHGDIGDMPAVSALLERHRPAWVLHLAAESHVDRSIDAPLAFAQTNVTATVALLQATTTWWRTLDPEARARFRFVHVSTDEVYGSLGPEGWFTESSPYAPNSPYAASKAASDHFARVFHHTFGLPVILTHGSNTYGPNQFPEKLIPVLTLSALAGEPLPVYGDGGHVRDWIHVEDHCRALCAVARLGQPGRAYNIGGGHERTNLEVAHAVCDAVDALAGREGAPSCRDRITFVADRPGHDRRYALDGARAEAELGFRPRVSFDEGLRQTVRWYRDHPTWVERIKSGGYRMQRAGLAPVPGV